MSLVQLGVEFQAKGATETKAALQGHEAAASGAAKATDSFASSQRGLRGAVSQLQRDLEGLRNRLGGLGSAFREGVSAGVAQAKALNQASAAANQAANANERLAVTQKRVSQAGVGLSRQFADLAVTGAMGMNPFMILLQQGPQIADQMALMKQQGIGLGQAMKSMGKDMLGVLGMFGPMLPAIAAIGAIGAVAFTGMSVAVKQLNADNKDLVNNLGLDAKQLETLKEKGVNTAITLGDAWAGTMAYLSKVVSDHTQGIQGFFGRMAETIATVSLKAIRAIVGGFAMGLAVIKNTWSQLPAVIGDAAVSAANAVIRAMNGLMSQAAAKINSFLSVANAIDKKILGNKGVDARVDFKPLSEIKNTNRGAVRGLHEGNIAAARNAAAGTNAFIDRQLEGIRGSILDAYTKRMRDEAGKAAKEKKAKVPKAPKEAVGAAGPRDMQDEAAAQTMRELQQSKLDELNAQLSLTKDTQKRVALQRQIIDAEVAVKNAQIDTQIAGVADMKGLNDAQKQQRVAALEQLKVANTSVAEMKKQAALQDGIAATAKESFAVEQARREASIDVLEAQKDATKDEKKKHLIEAEILQQKQDLRKVELEQITEANGYGAAEVAAAKERLKVLGGIFVAQQEQLTLTQKKNKEAQKASDSFNSVSSAFDSVSDAFKQHNWGEALMDLAKAIQTAREAIGTAGQKFGGIAGLVAGLGKLIGGTAGKAITGGAQGAMGGFQAGNQINQLLGGGLSFLGPVGAIAGGVFGFLGSIFGGNKQKRAERRAKEQEAAEKAAQKAQEIAEQKRDLELRLIEASGDQIAILAAQRDKELNSVDASNRALMEQVLNAEEAKKRFDKVRDLEIDALRLSGNEVAALAAERKKEMEAIDATLQPLQALYNTAKDASDALAAAKDVLQASYDSEIERLSEELSKAQEKVSAAHDVLSAAYDREAGRLGDMVSRLRDFSQTLREFRKSLDTDTAGLSPENAYNRAKAEFQDVSARARMGDQDAQNRYVEVAQAFKQASGDFFGMGPGYFADINQIKLSTDMAAATADRTATNAEQQLEQLKSLVSGYLDVNESTISVRDAITQLQAATQAQETAQQALDNTKAIVEPLLGINQGVMSLTQAIANYQAAQAAQAAVQTQLLEAIAQAKANPANQPVPANPSTINQGYQSTNGDYGAYVRGQADLMALFSSGKGMARGRTIEEFGLYHWANFGKNENRSVRPFATGGRFMVGGMGGTDSQRVAFDASPNERVTVETPAQMARAAEAQEKVARLLEKIDGKLSVMAREAEAEPARYVERNRLLQEGFEELGDRVETGQRRAA